MKLKELLEYLNHAQPIQVKFHGLKSNVIEKDDVDEEWLNNTVKSIETKILNGSKGRLFSIPDKSFMTIEIEQ